MSHFLHSLLLDKLYAKGVYFCSFVTKSNQACTKCSARCVQPFHRAVIHGEYHKIFASTTPSNSFSTQFTIKPIPYVASQFFLHYFHLNLLQKINKISVGSEKTSHMLFFCFKENYFL